MSRPKRRRAPISPPKTSPKARHGVRAIRSTANRSAIPRAAAAFPPTIIPKAGRASARRKTRVPDARARGTLSNSRLGVMAAIAALGVLVGGVVLATAGSAVADITGIGSSIVGFLLVGFATSLPELSSVLAALRLRRYQMPSAIFAAPTCSTSRYCSLPI